MDDKEKYCGNIVAETIFAGEKVEEFSLHQSSAVLRFSDTKFPRFFENFFVGYGPCYACDGNCQNEKPDNLCRKFHEFIFKVFGLKNYTFSKVPKFAYF